MNLLQSDNTYEELIQHMETCGYSPYHIHRVKREMKWLSKNQDAHEISSYEEACRLRSLETESAEMKEQFRSIYSLFRRYALYGTLVTPVREPLFRQNTYSQLSPYFQNILDIYKKDSIGRGLKPGTYRASISACSGLFLHCQKKGCETLEDITEDMVLSYFCTESGKPTLSSSTKVNIASVFHADLGMYTNAARTILSYLPALNRRRPPVNPSVQEQLAMMPAGCMKPHPSDKGNRIGKVPIFSGITSQLLFPETTSPAL